MVRFIFLLLCWALSWDGLYTHDLRSTLVSMIVYYTIGGFCIDYAKSDVYERNSSIFQGYGIKSSDDINIRFSFRDFLVLLVGFSIGQLLFALFNGGLFSFVLSLVPWALGLEMATWPHKKIETYIGREKFLGFDWHWPQWLDESLRLSMSGPTSSSSDEEWEGYAMEVIEKLKQHPGCSIGLIGLRKDSSGNASYLNIQLSEHKEAEAEWSIKRFFASFGDGIIEFYFYTSEGKLVDSYRFQNDNTPIE